LEVTGHKLGERTSTIRADVRSGGQFMNSGIIFPSPGCYRMTARLDSAVLRFVTLVKYPTASGS
jgi:hypothetical protein